MASLVQQGSWSTPSILAGYGLSAKIGPTEQTSTDTMRLNSRSGGKFSGKGNWMQDYRPKPIMGSGRPKKMYDYEKGDSVVVQRRPEGLVNRKIGSFRMTKKISKKAGMGPARDIDGVMVPQQARDGEKQVNDDLFDKNEEYVPETPTDVEMVEDSPTSADSPVQERFVPTNTFGLNVTRIPTAPHISQDMAALKRIPSYDGRDYKNKRLRIDTSDKKRKAKVEVGPSKKRIIDYK